MDDAGRRIRLCRFQLEPARLHVYGRIVRLWALRGTCTASVMHCVLAEVLPVVRTVEMTVLDIRNKPDAGVKTVNRMLMRGKRDMLRNLFEPACTDSFGGRIFRKRIQFDELPV